MDSPYTASASQQNGSTPKPAQGTTDSNGTNGSTTTNGLSLGNDELRRQSTTESVDQQSLLSRRNVDEDEEAYLLRISQQNSRQSSITLDREPPPGYTGHDSGIISPVHTALSCAPFKFIQHGYHLKQASETVKSSPIKLLISLPIGFPQHGHPNLTKEILSSVKTSLDGILNADTGLDQKNVLVVIYVEFGWLETTVNLLKKFGAMTSAGERSTDRAITAHMYESTIRPGIGNADNLMQTVVLIPPQGSDFALDSEQWMTSFENDVKPWAAIRVPVRTAVRASLLKAYWRKASESSSLGHRTEKFTYDIVSVRNTGRALKEKVRST